MALLLAVNSDMQKNKCTLLLPLLLLLLLLPPPLLFIPCQHPLFLFYVYIYTLYKIIATKKYKSSYRHYYILDSPDIYV